MSDVFLGGKIVGRGKFWSRMFSCKADLLTSQIVEQVHFSWRIDGPVIEISCNGTYVGAITLIEQETGGSL